MRVVQWHRVAADRDDGVLPSSTYIHVSGSIRRRESSGHGTAHSLQPWVSVGHQTLTNTLKKTRERSSGRRQITSSDGSHLHLHVSKSSYDTGYYMPEEPALPLALG